MLKLELALSNFFLFYIINIDVSSKASMEDTSLEKIPYSGRAFLHRPKDGVTRIKFNPSNCDWCWNPIPFTYQQDDDNKKKTV